MAPKLIAPMSTALSTSQKPMFRWTLAGNTTGAKVDICNDRACNNVVSTFASTGTGGSPTTALPKGVYFWRARGMIGSTAGTATSPVWELRVGARSASVNTSWGSFVDVNGDGLADLIVSAVSNATGASIVYVYLGSRGSSLPMSPSTTLTGPSNSSFGLEVESAGDVDGDGFTDIIVGADRAGVGGEAFVYRGGATGLSTSPAATITSPVGAGAQFGGAVAGAGDVNGDGYADILVGAFLVNGQVGAAYLYLGGPNGVTTTPATSLAGTGSSAHFGEAAGAGDVNGDRYGDIVVGAWGTNTTPVRRTSIWVDQRVSPRRTPSCSAVPW